MTEEQLNARIAASLAAAIQRAREGEEGLIAWMREIVEQMGETLDESPEPGRE